MAESIYTTLKNNEIAITDKDVTITVSLPEWTPTDTVFESEEALLTHCTESGILHSILQSGIKHEIIQIRAVARPSGQTQTFQDLEVQKRVSDYVPSTTKRPGQSKSKMSPEDMLKA